VVVATKREENHEKCWNEVFFVITLHQENKVLTFKKDKSYDNKDFQCKEDAHEHSCSSSFSFVFTVNANALPLENTQVDNLEIRVKGCPNEDSQNNQEEDFDIVSFISYVLQNIFGVRV
jgi:hypothetical protein